MSSKNKEACSGEVKGPVKVCKWDNTAVKNALDDAVKEVMTSKLPYTECHSLMDGRLAICGVAVAIAMFGLLWDFLNPFPQSRPVLIACVGAYFLLMSVLTLYTTYKEKGIFVVVLQKDPAGLDPDSRWQAASKMKNYDDIYELTVTFTDGKNAHTREAADMRSVAEFIDENGTICMDKLEPVVIKMHNSLSTGKKDK